MRVVRDMRKVILIKYGELSTKKGNRNYFINTLFHQVKSKLKNYSVSITRDRAKMLIFFEDKDLDSIKNIIDKIFGIHTYQIASICDSSLEDIKKTLLEVVSEEKFSTFKIETKRSDKSFPIQSTELSPMLGGFLLKSIPNIKVDVHHPELLVHIEIREDYTYIYHHSYTGSGGYPVGTQPLGLLMLSGGIDSPVAGYLAMKRGVVIDAVYFEAIPHTSLEAREKVITLCRKLSNYTDKIRLHIVNFTFIQENIYKYCRDDYCITIMRRMMYRIMDLLCKKYSAYAIFNGESVGQVASQTLTSMNVINSVTNVPVIRPVACLDKLEIMEIARKIDTYETSILPYEDCCTVFVPKHPAINPKLDICLKEEDKFDYQSMIHKAIDDIIDIEITSEYTSFEELL